MNLPTLMVAEHVAGRRYGVNESIW
jgi:hypothetical protein